VVGNSFKPIMVLENIIEALLFITAVGSGGIKATNLILIILGLPALLLIGYLAERYLLIRLIARFDHVKEYIFLLSIGWCLGMAQLAVLMGLSDEIGAFIAGVSLAASPIALYISENLKPVRDFFLVLFFFSVGATLDFHYFPSVIVPALILALLLLVVKPAVFGFLLKQTGERKSVTWEVGARLGQASEFSLLVAYLAASSANALIGQSASFLIQATTILTFFVSSYWVVLRYPTPLALTEKMRRD